MKNFPGGWADGKKGQKEVRFANQPESHNKQTPAWQFHKRDKDHPEWGWDKLTAEDFCALLHQHLCNFETMTWAEILAASGGRAHGNNHHLIAVDKCSKEARERLQALSQDDTDEIFSLRISGKLRLFGVKEGRVLRFIWHDPEHSVYPVKG